MKIFLFKSVTFCIKLIVHLTNLKRCLNDDIYIFNAHFFKYRASVIEKDELYKKSLKTIEN